MSRRKSPKPTEPWANVFEWTHDRPPGEAGSLTGRNGILEAIHTGRSPEPTPAPTPAPLRIHVRELRGLTREQIGQRVDFLSSEPDFVKLATLAKDMKGNQRKAVEML